ncbi:SDR family NAD(P)-dependent oxidoreductase [Flammeovirga sp. MY04]|uniref:SDR family NAD(P)-dependent oxidoreductase n=1 Tax=Flammeovirga sp. MY04 TaxID=1191459 RepID=UPI000806284C|nr:SDR family NAD(P)-dependent oxidoreductase [Flammeovirga sp. MY04]ANQ49292.1 SDR family NAD(P)-dependent oxidoreductase [Flammeovirga sp. MY04]
MSSNIFITGTSKGLGSGFAEYYLEKGDRVFGLSRSAAPQLDAQENYTHSLSDVSDFDQIKENIQSLLSGVDHLQVVILNAGILGEIKGITEASISEMKEVMDINLWANKIILDTLYEMSIEVNQVVVISSGASINGNKGWSGYSISKAAVNMLVKLYAAEYPSTHYTALAPGLIDTGMQDYLCEVVDHDKFPSMQRLKEARGTDVMPKPKEAAKRIGDIIPALLMTPNGSYEDVRKL